ncbi:hypothetical protein U1Q18_033370 [Sarracenia purpurea var. burkii]
MVSYVEEITNPIITDKVLKNNPNYVLSQPWSQGGDRHILRLSPESELKRGSIHFLIPTSSLSVKIEKKRSHYDLKQSTTMSEKGNSEIMSKKRSSSLHHWS